MNTPSKEALEAAKRTAMCIDTVRSIEELAAIIDRHFDPLRAEIVQLTVDRDNWKIRAEEMDGYKADCMELRQRAEQAEQMARDWETAANLYQRDFHTEASRAKQAEARVKELEATISTASRGNQSLADKLDIAEKQCCDWKRVAEVRDEAVQKLQIAKAELAEALRDAKLSLLDCAKEFAARGFVASRDIALAYADTADAVLVRYSAGEPTKDEIDTSNEAFLIVQRAGKEMRKHLERE